MKGNRRKIAVLFVAVYAAVLVIDWTARLFPFHFGYHAAHFFMLDQVGEKTPYYRKNSTFDQPIYGYLSFLLGIDSYKQYHRQRLTTNSDGLRQSTPPLADGSWPVTITGDSFAFGSYNSDEDILSKKLEEKLELPVRNLAFPGNPVTPVLELLGRGENLSPVIIWGMTERSMTKDNFESARVFQGRGEGVKRDIQFSTKGFSCFREWFTVYAKDSCIRWIANSLWNHVRFYLLGKIPEELWTPLHPSMLFYREGVMLMGREADADFLRIIADGAQNLVSLCALRGAATIILLIPDKCSIYPENVFDAGRRVKLEKNRFLDRMETALLSRGLNVINLKPYFYQKKNQGLLYFPDDTHWNPRGIGLAANIIAIYLSERNLVQINRNTGIE